MRQIIDLNLPANVNDRIFFRDQTPDLGGVLFHTMLHEYALLLLVRKRRDQVQNAHILPLLQFAGVDKVLLSVKASKEEQIPSDFAYKNIIIINVHYIMKSPLTYQSYCTRMLVLA